MDKLQSSADLLQANIYGTAPKSLLAVSGVALSLYLLYLRSLPKPLPGFPYDEQSAKRIMGDIPNLVAKKENGEIPRLYFIDLFDIHNSPVAQYFLGPLLKTAVAIGDFREVQDLLLRHGKDLVRGNVNNQTWRGTMPHHFIAMEEDDPAFKYTKSLGKDLMTPAFLHEVNAPASYQKALNFVDLWKLKAASANGHAFDAAADLGFLTYDIITAAAYNIDDEDTQIKKVIRELEAMPQPATLPSSKADVAVFPTSEPTALLQSLYTLAKSLGSSFSSPSISLFHFFNNRKAHMRKAYHDRDTITKSYLSDAVRRFKEAGDNFSPTSAVDHLVTREAAAAEKEGREPNFFSDTMIQISYGYVLGGQDSTHATLSFLVKHLGASQDVQTTLRGILRKKFPEAYANREQPPLQELVKAQIPYLDAVVEEVLRRDPPAPAVQRVAKKDLTVLGRTIPKGTMMLFALHGATFTSKGYVPGGEKQSEGEVLRSESSRSHAGDFAVDDWSKSAFPAEEFRPERWLKESEDGSGELVFNPKAGPFLTFSTGNRVCWGKRLAYLELKLVTTVFVWNFVFNRLPAELEDWVYGEDLFMKPKNCRVLLSSAWDV